MRVTTNLRILTNLFLVLSIVVGVIATLYTKKVANSNIDKLGPNFRSVYALEGMLQEIGIINKENFIESIGRLERLYDIQSQNIDIDGEQKETLDIKTLITQLSGEITGGENSKVEDIILKLSTKIKLLIAINRDEIEYKTHSSNKQLFYNQIAYMAILFLLLYTYYFFNKKYINQLDNDFKKISITLDSALSGGEQEIDVGERIQIRKLLEKIIKLANNKKFTDEDDLLQFEKAKLLLTELSNNADFAVALISNVSEIEFCNDKFDAFLENLSSKLHSIEGKKVFAAKLSELAKVDSLKIATEEFNELFDQELSGNKLYTKRLKKGGVNYGVLAIFKHSASIFDTNAIELLARDALIALNSVHLTLHAVLEHSLGEEVPAKVSEFLFNARNECYKIRNILENIADSHLLTDGELRFESINFVELIQEVTNSFKIVAKTKNIEFICDLKLHQVVVYGVATQLKILLNNLYDNAIKISPVNEIINIKLDKKDDMVVFAINNFGKVIAKEYLEQIFDKYYKMPGDKTTGDGLGLFLARKVIQNHGGYIWVESSEVAGTTFWVSLKVIDA